MNKKSETEVTVEIRSLLSVEVVKKRGNHNGHFSLYQAVTVNKQHRILSPFLRQPEARQILTSLHMHSFTRTKQSFTLLCL